MCQPLCQHTNFYSKHPGVAIAHLPSLSFPQSHSSTVSASLFCDLLKLCRISKQKTVLDNNLSFNIFHHTSARPCSRQRTAAVGKGATLLICLLTRRSCSSPLGTVGCKTHSGSAGGFRRAGRSSAHPERHRELRAPGADRARTRDPQDGPGPAAGAGRHLAGSRRDTERCHRARWDRQGWSGTLSAVTRQDRDSQGLSRTPSAVPR